METRSNQILVGSVVLALLATVIAFAVWLARMSDGQSKEYDILFSQSVDGLAKGSAVAFSGVPVGQVQKIALMPESPQFVRVRISIDDEVLITIGTTAALQSVGFTGVSQIQLEGSVKGAPSLADIGPYGVPIIPTRQVGLGALLNNAPQLVERISTLTERLNELMSEKNQKHIAGTLANMDRLTGTLADQGPELATTLKDAHVTIQQAGVAAEQLGRLAGTANELLDKDGRPMLTDLRKTLAAAEHSMNSLDQAVSEARPGVRTLTTETLPEVTQLIRDLQATTDSLRSITGRLDERGAGAVINGKQLPDYHP
jgi:phospholipid/cholesterol/gamma-HCH transport system substrate-binding protein